MNTFDLTHALRDVRTNSVIAICLLIKRDCKMFTAMACLCVLLGGPSYAAGAESLIIAGATYCEPGASGPGWAWTDADRLELNGYTGEAIGADGDLVVTLTGRDERARRGHLALRHGGVGRSDVFRQEDSSKKSIGN